MTTRILGADAAAFSFHSEAASDAGRVRETNEDRFGIDDRGLWIVADGLGGHVAGEVAAQIAVETLGENLEKELAGASDSELASVSALEIALQRALQATSRHAFEMSQENREWTGMGATVVALWIVGNRAFVAHLGDSRAYLWRDELMKITTDHSLIELLVESGDLTREESKTHPMRHQITRFCGMEGEALADASSREVQNGDAFLLCSDGVSNELGDEELVQLLASQATAAQIVAAAVEAGGRDNATALIVRVETALPKRLETLALKSEDQNESGN